MSFLFCMMGIIACGGSKSKKAVVVTFQDTLNRLGFQTDLGNLKDINGNEFSTDYHPLRKKISVYSKIDEVYFAGGKYYEGDGSPYETNQNKYFLFQDGKTSATYDVIYSSKNDDAWTEKPLVTGKGDVDGDGRDEALTIVYNPDTKEVFLRVIDYTGGSYAETSTKVSYQGVLTLFGNDVENYHYILDLDTGDIDGDSKDEIVYVVGNHVTVLDDKDAGYNPLFSKSFGAEGETGQNFTHTAVGDLNEDGRAEIVAAYGVDEKSLAHYYIYGYTNNAVTLIKDNSIASAANTIQYANVDIGDVDGDRRNEIVFAGDHVSGQDYGILILDDYTTNYTFLNTYAQKGRIWAWHRSVAVQVFRPDGPGTREKFLVYRTVYELADNGTIQAAAGIGSAGEIYDYERNKAAAGDVNGDGREDIVIQQLGDMYFLGFNSSGSWGELRRYDIDHDYYASLTCLNIDDDSAIVRYTGDHEVKFTSPKVVAVLASPPYHTGVKADIGSSETVFGLSSETGTESAHSFGLEVGFSIGYEVEAPFFGSSAGSSSFKINVGASFDTTTTAISSQSIGKSFSCPAGEDQVIITAIPFDVYYYEILSAPIEAAGTVGTIVTINVPRKPQMIPIERNTFNNEFKEVVQIDSTVLGHTIGVVKSYPTQIEANILVNNTPTGTTGKMITPDEYAITVGKASGTQTIELSRATGSSTAINFEFTAGAEFENTAGGVVVGGSFEFKYGYEYTVSTTDTTTISGTVANIYPEAWKEGLVFTTGLFALPVVKGDQTFIVVTYWVNGS